VSKAFNAIEQGDVLQINEVRYFAAGKVTMQTPDGSTWEEWLLCPAQLKPENAIAGLNHKWLAADQEHGLTLWSPANIAQQHSLDALGRGKIITINGTNYKATEVDEARVIHYIGDLGGDCTVGDKFSYADMRGNGTLMLSIEWNQTEQEAMFGRRVPDAEIYKWAKAAGKNIIGRIPLTSYKKNNFSSSSATSSLNSDSESMGPLGWLITAAVFTFAVMLESCDGDDNCYQRMNSTTNQYETVCEDGVRTRNGRGFSGWGGK
jgi:Domain of unknown function (DUF4178)